MSNSKNVMNVRSQIHIGGSFCSAISFAAKDELIETIKNGDLDPIENINFQD